MRHASERLFEHVRNALWFRPQATLVLAQNTHAKISRHLDLSLRHEERLRDNRWTWCRFWTAIEAVAIHELKRVRADTTEEARAQVQARMDATQWARDEIYHLTGQRPV